MVVKFHRPQPRRNNRYNYSVFSVHSSERSLSIFLSLHGAAPEYLRDCCIGTHSSASGLRLRSLEKTDLRVRRMRTEDEDPLRRSCFAAGPWCWNSLPPAIRLADSVDSFKVQLKTYLFAKAYPV